MLLIEECKALGLFIDHLNNKKNKLQVLDKGYKGAVTRSRAERFLAAESPRKRALADGKEIRK